MEWNGNVRCILKFIQLKSDMKKKMSKKEKIRIRLEFFDVMVKEARRRIELGEPIPSMKVLIQP